MKHLFLVLFVFSLNGMFIRIKNFLKVFKNFTELYGRPQVEEPVPMAGCDPDFGWNDGADGSGKCYRVIKNADYM